MRLVNIDEVKEAIRIDCENADAKEQKAIAQALYKLDDVPTIDAIPIGCLELEKRDCSFADQCDMGSSYGRERERACKNIIDWWKTPSYQRCLDVATERGFVKEKWSED